MNWTLALAAASLALAACSDPADAPFEPDPEAAVEVGTAEPLPRELPSPDQSPRYLGMWATTVDDCDEPPIRFEADRVSTLGEVSCEFNTVTPTQAGYEIAATCYAEAPPAPYTIRISFAESARAMMTTGAPWAATSFVYCRGL